MKELSTQTGIIVKCSKTAIKFFQNTQSEDLFSVLEIPKEFQDIAVEFYDLTMENDHLIACFLNNSDRKQKKTRGLNFTKMMTITSSIKTNLSKIKFSQLIQVLPEIMFIFIIRYSLIVMQLI